MHQLSTRPKAPLYCQNSQRLHAAVPRSRLDTTYDIWRTGLPKLNESLVPLVMGALLAPAIAGEANESEATERLILTYRDWMKICLPSCPLHLTDKILRPL